MKTHGLRRSVWIAGGLMLLALVLQGCAEQTQSSITTYSMTLANRTPIAVIPFENSTANSQAGTIMAELYTNEIRATHKFVVLPTETVTAKLAGLEGQSKTPQDLAKALGVRALVVGRVTEYTYKTGLSEDPAIGLSVRLVDGQTGEVLWSGARSGTGHISWFKQDGLSRLGQEVCKELASEMADDTDSEKSHR